jgi:hypothetical protein
LAALPPWALPAEPANAMPRQSLGTSAPYLLDPVAMEPERLPAAEVAATLRGLLRSARRSLPHRTRSRISARTAAKSSWASSAG